MARGRKYVKGDLKLRLKLRRLPEEATEELRDFVRETAEEVQFEAAKNLSGHVLTGETRRAWLDPKRIKFGRDKLTASIGFHGKRQKRTFARYKSIWLEFGTDAGKRGHRPTRPTRFLSKGADKAIAHNKPLLKKKIDTAFRRVARGL